MRLIQTFDEADENALRFQYVSDHPNSTAFKNLSKYYHWYYFPQHGAFAPSKFIGYANTSIEKYASKGTGTDTTRALHNHFNKLTRPSQYFDNLLEELASWLQGMGFNVSEKTINGTGGIYVPKASLPKFRHVSNSEVTNNFAEGARVDVTQSRSERSPAARAKCLELHGLSCLACGFNFKLTYGELGANFIHVHHLNPLRAIKNTYIVDPKKDLVPLCPNCHAMIHRLEEPASVEQLKKHLQRS